MKSESIWINSNKLKEYPVLQKDIETDVAIIGGGICGITAAQILSQAGLQVVLLESGRIAESNTGRSTGNLYCLLDIPFEDLYSKYSHNEIQKIITSRKEAVDTIENLISEFSIVCEFKRVPWTKFSATPETDDQIRNEYELLKNHFSEIQWLDETDPKMRRLKGRQGYMIKDQAQFNPFEYVQQLAYKLQNKNCEFFEMSHVEEIADEGHYIKLKTSEGNVRAKYLIEATHTPLGVSPLHTLLAPYREYGVAGKLKVDLPHEGIYWGYYEKGKVTSIRSYEKDSTKYMMIIGGPHKVGQGDSQEKINHLIDQGKGLDLFSETDYQWGGQHYRPADFLPYIGKGLNDKRFLATGFSTDGLVYGTVAAKIISNIINEKTDDYAALYRARRFTPWKSGKKFIQENINVLKQYVVDYLHKEEVPSLHNGEGSVINFEGHKYAISKDNEGEVKICSAVCPHLGCIVHWNNAEMSWDCPCHGSRFKNDGAVIEGPTLQGLEQLETESINLERLTSQDRPMDRIVSQGI